ncbi:MAG: LacI family DNA-binding transcriptional regulator [Kiritimatiellae bacterium]|jgi:DNA-binding LacI/PurR family transcriptional regulator|nr:LacI family DNA-binding transcriptional regulator [Kiritimatiellia bacterium]
MKNKRVTLKQIADETGVSVAAVSAVLNDKVGKYLRVGKGTQEKIKEVAQKLGYRPSAAARMMLTNKTNQIAVFLPNKPEHRTTTPMNYETILGMNSVCQEHNYLLVLVCLHDLLNRDDIGSRVFQEHAVDGALMLGSVDDNEDELLTKLFPMCVWCDTSYWQPKSCVRRDEVKAGYIATKALLDAGHRELIWIEPVAHDAGHYSFKERFDGVNKAIAEFDGNVKKLIDPSDAEMRKVLKKGSAFIASNYPIIENLSYTAMQSKLAVGSDISFVCCDDMNIRSVGAWRNLSRCSFDRFEMGRIAAQMLIKKITTGSEPTSKKVVPELIVGNSIVR